MKLYETLEEVLMKEPNFITDEGELKKWVVISKAQNFDEELISLLLDNSDLKSKFFIKVKNTLVFNQSLFIQFLEQKNYLNDSYTAYKNKIGLTIEGKFLKQRNEVSLVWPFKDCVLEGGQSKEEDDREEIFFNETLAQDEITQLLEPKVITNAKRYTSKGAKSFDKFYRNEQGVIKDNLIVKGNNLLALHSLKKQFAEKVKLIYIDPPFNTGGSAETFTYNNSFKHSTWYTFIRNRIMIAKELLRDDGFLSIAIDHNELFYLGIIADEIFGRDNRLGVITVVHKPEGRQFANFFSASNEFMLVYAKDKALAEFEDVILDKEKEDKFKLKDDNGNYRLKNFIRLTDGKYSLRINKPDGFYPIYVNKQLDKFSLDKIDGYHIALPITDKGVERVWKTLGRTFMKKVTEGKIVAKKENDRIVLYEKLPASQVFTTHWIKKEYHSYHYGTKLLEEILGRKAFSFPKSVYTVLDTVKLMSSNDDIVMDFYSGSATTAHAILELNSKDEGSRQFVLVEQLLDHIEICKERTIKVIKKLGLNTSFVYFELKKYNQEFIEKIEYAKNPRELLHIWEEMKTKSFLNYNVDIKKQDEHIEEFKSLSLKEQKQHLFEILDKNQLYVNLSSLNDNDFACSDEEKKITKEFYQIQR